MRYQTNIANDINQDIMINSIKTNITNDIN